MQFSSRFTIAVHILVCTAVFQDKQKVTSNFLAGSIQVNPVTVRSVLGRLSEAGPVETRAGVGGTFLARDAGDITLLDIFRAVEKEEALFRFHENPDPHCPVGRNIHSVLDGRINEIQLSMEKAMSGTDLARLVRETEALP